MRLTTLDIHRLGKELDTDLASKAVNNHQRLFKEQQALEVDLNDLENAVEERIKRGQATLGSQLVYSVADVLTSGAKLLAAPVQAVNAYLNGSNLLDELEQRPYESVPYSATVRDLRGEILSVQAKLNLIVAYNDYETRQTM